MSSPEVDFVVRGTEFECRATKKSGVRTIYLSVAVAGFECCIVWKSATCEVYIIEPVGSDANYELLIGTWCNLSSPTVPGISAEPNEVWPSTSIS